VVGLGYGCSPCFSRLSGVLAPAPAVWVSVWLGPARSLAFCGRAVVLGFRRRCDWPCWLGAGITVGSLAGGAAGAGPGAGLAVGRGCAFLRGGQAASVSMLAMVLIGDRCAASVGLRSFMRVCDCGVFVVSGSVVGGVGTSELVVGSFNLMRLPAERSGWPRSRALWRGFAHRRAAFGGCGLVCVHRHLDGRHVGSLLGRFKMQAAAGFMVSRVMERHARHRSGRVGGLSGSAYFGVTFFVGRLPIQIGLGLLLLDGVPRVGYGSRCTAAGPRFNRSTVGESSGTCAKYLRVISALISRRAAIIFWQA